MWVRQLLQPVLTCVALASVFTPAAKLFGDDESKPTRKLSTGPTHEGSTTSHPMPKINSHFVGYAVSDVDAWKRPAPKIRDVALNENGNLHGYFVDHIGQPLGGRLIVARQGTQKVRTAKSDASGAFEISGLRGGNWSVIVGTQTSLLRVWNAGSAPPTAKSNLLLVRKASIVRGQSIVEPEIMTAFDNGALFSAGATLTSVTLLAVGISEASKASHDEQSAPASSTMANDETAATRSSSTLASHDPETAQSFSVLAFDGATEQRDELNAIEIAGNMQSLAIDPQNRQLIAINSAFDPLVITPVDQLSRSPN
jgi:hypothetical protein